MALSKITIEKRELLKQKSAQSLPDVPSLHNWTPKQFKNAITKVLFDNNDSFFAYFNTLTDELEEQFLTKADEKVVFLNEQVFASENNFALKVLQTVATLNSPKIFFGQVGTRETNTRTVVGVYHKSSDANKVVIIDGNGTIKLSNGTELMALAIPDLSSYKAAINEARINSIILDASMDATNASITLPNEAPLYSNHAVPKFYVDDIRDSLQDQIYGIEAAQNLLDIVGTYKTGDDNLLSYPTTNLKKNDKIKVLQDEYYGNAGTYYKWTDEKTGVFHWEYIGKDGIYYTQTEVDNKINILEGQITALRNLINTLTSSNVSYKEE